MGSTNGQLCFNFAKGAGMVSARSPFNILKEKNKP